MNAYLETTDSPAGSLTFAVDDDEALLWLAFNDGQYERTIEEELTREGRRLHYDRTRTAPVRSQLEEYARGTRPRFDIPLALVGTPWQQTVWRALIEIPFGQTRTYGQVAAMIGHPTAARAMGRANATNRIPLVIPCHRVIGAGGSLTGFGGGLHLKERLLAHEARHAAMMNGASG
ncbi:MAG TPA: methylated-DNA--[protein]-cysteine S-methyltransferase [Chloroflexota bacterium]|nr:methylated-DNA--[protein]-cysteine S-methyltransferase [Chloroflexota bacterium]